MTFEPRRCSSLRPTRTALLPLLLVAASGCEDYPLSGAEDAGPDASAVDGRDPFPPEAASTDGGLDGSVVDSSAGDGAGADLASGDAADAGDVSGGPAPIGMAVLSSDYQSTVLSLLTLGPTPTLRDRCLDSGSVSPQLSAALSGDVVLPSSPQLGNPVTLIDRKNSTLTWVNPATCDVLRQMNVGPGFASNPYDVAQAAPDKAYVARYDSHPSDPAQGNDLLIIDPRLATVTGRVDLRAHSDQVVPPAKALLPRPAAVLALAGKVYVLLGHQSDDFMVSGPGRVLVIDPSSNTVAHTINLPTLKNCARLQALFDGAGAPVLVVGCSGPFTDGAAQVNSSGFAWINLAGTPLLTQVVAGPAFGRPVGGSSVSVFDANRAFTVVPGDFMGPAKDAVHGFGFVTGASPAKILEGEGAFILSLGLDRQRGLLYLANASAAQPRIQIYTVAAGAVTPTAMVVPNPSTGLPPRQIAAY